MLSRMLPKSISMVLASGLFLLACSGSGGTIDAGSENDGYVDGTADAGDPVLTRELVEGVDGFCRTLGPIDDSCEEASDCQGYRLPVPMDCYGEIVRTLSQFDCASANAETPPATATKWLARSICAAVHRRGGKGSVCLRSETWPLGYQDILSKQTSNRRVRSRFTNRREIEDYRNPQQLISL